MRRQSKSSGISSITHLKDSENHKKVRDGNGQSKGNIKDKRRNKEINQVLFLKFVISCLRFSSGVIF